MIIRQHHRWLKNAATGSMALVLAMLSGDSASAGGQVSWSATISNTATVSTGSSTSTGSGSAYASSSGTTSATSSATAANEGGTSATSGSVDIDATGGEISCSALATAPISGGAEFFTVIDLTVDGVVYNAVLTCEGGAENGGSAEIDDLSAEIDFTEKDWCCETTEGNDAGGNCVEKAAGENCPGARPKPLFCGGGEITQYDEHNDTYDVSSCFKGR